MSARLIHSPQFIFLSLLISDVAVELEIDLGLDINGVNICSLL